MPPSGVAPRRRNLLSGARCRSTPAPSSRRSSAAPDGAWSKMLRFPHARSWSVVEHESLLCIWRMNIGERYLRLYDRRIAKVLYNKYFFSRELASWRVSEPDPRPYVHGARPFFFRATSQVRSILPSIQKAQGKNKMRARCWRR